MEQCAQLWPEMVCMTMTAWLGSHVPCVAGARFRAASAKFVWDVKACGAYGVSAARHRILVTKFVYTFGDPQTVPFANPK